MHEMHQNTFDFYGIDNAIEQLKNKKPIEKNSPNV